MKLFQKNAFDHSIPELDVLANRELAMRSPRVAFIWVPLAILVILITDLKEKHLLQSILAVSLFVISGIYRIYLSQRFETTYHASPERWVNKFTLVVLLSASIFGISLPLLYFESGSNWTFIICLLTTTGITAVATGSLSPRRGLFRLFVLVVHLPIVTILLALGNLQEMGLGLLTAVFMVHILILGGYFHQIFWSGLRDAHQLKERAAALELASAEIKAANQAKGEFLTNISHEIRTPLNGILGLTELVLDGELESHQRDNLKDVHGSGLSLLHTINELLDFSKIEAGEMTMESSVFSLPDTLQKVVLASSMACIKHGNNLKIELGENFPDRMIGDSYRIEQILNNLMSNAVKFTRNGEIRLIGKLVKRVEGLVAFSITVKDSGIGITPEDQEIIFQAFKQVDCSTTRGFGGTGLGLAICRHLVGLMDGEITLESTLAQGSEFTIYLTLPEAQIPSGGPKTGNTAIANAHLGDDLQGMQVLLVEDNTVNAKLATRVLEKSKIRVTWAKNGQESVIQYIKGNFDLVLMDIQMPVLDGFGATKAIREAEKATGRRTPIIALTAHAIQGYRQKCLDADLDDYLTKPLQPKALRETLVKWSPRVLQQSRR